MYQNFCFSMHLLGQQNTQAMAAMNIRAVMTATGRVTIYACPSSNRTTAKRVIARHQFRDEQGRFRSYIALGLALQISTLFRAQSSQS